MDAGTGFLGLIAFAGAECLTKCAVCDIKEPIACAVEGLRKHVPFFRFFGSAIG